jgi:hypothetical protein
MTLNMTRITSIFLSQWNHHFVQMKVLLKQRQEMCIWCLCTLSYSYTTLRFSQWKITIATNTLAINKYDTYTHQLYLRNNITTVQYTPTSPLRIHPSHSTGNPCSIAVHHQHRAYHQEHQLLVGWPTPFKLYQ